ncbi:nucleotidyltransferase domain-containing protein [Candidatus Woesearchaeota archaeon]|nr:nucleotidyltransferase domain-containing protein [Candidatus Woesearchaeota archaeon]
METDKIKINVMMQNKVIQEIIEKAKKDKQVLAVSIFGSVARGEQYSRDIDICIFLKPHKYTSYELSGKLLEYAHHNEKYDVQIFQHLPLYIRIPIINEGKIIFCKDEDALYDLYFGTLRDYEHFKPIYEGYLEAVLNE